MMMAACAPSAGESRSGGGSAGTGQVQSASTPKRLTAAIRGLAVVAYQKLNPRSNIPGEDSLERLAASGLTVPALDGNGRLPRLADAAPTVDNGNWKLLPDGTMETRWTIKDGARWSDGTPITTDDLLFTMQVVRDKELPIFDHAAYASLGSVETINNRTVVAHWTKTYIYADQLFSFEIALPFPKHKLEQAYLNDKEHFTDNPGWGPEMVGSGPFKVKDWQLGSLVVFEANDQYILGRPKIDEITVKFIPDPNTLAANILAGAVDTTWGGRTDIEWAQEVYGKWQDGKLDTYTSLMLQIYPQMIGSTPAVISQSADFRRALTMALDRQAMADTFQLGRSSVGHTFLAPSEPEYQFIEPAIVKYAYDPQRSLQILQGLGYTRGTDGALRDASGQQLSFQVRTSQGDVTQEKAMQASADDWQRLGAEVERFLVPPQRANDAEFRATFPSFDVKRQAGTMDYAKSFLTRAIALPTNNFLASGNNSRYSRPEMDAAINNYYTTVPWDERMEYARQVVHELSDDAAWIGLYYVVEPGLVPNKLTNLRAGRAEVNRLDFIHEWDIQR
jgi:peptide/nickel transport system substrate-binding protein